MVIFQPLVACTTLDISLYIILLLTLNAFNFFTNSIHFIIRISTFLISVVFIAYKFFTNSMFFTILLINSWTKFFSNNTSLIPAFISHYKCHVLKQLIYYIIFIWIACIISGNKLMFTFNKHFIQVYKMWIGDTHTMLIKIFALISAQTHE